MKGLNVFTGIIGLGVLIMVIWFFIDATNNSIKENKFSNYIISNHTGLNIPIEHFSEKQYDSIKKLKVTKEKIEVEGRYGVYGFYMWYKPTEKGEIFIKGFEIDENIELSKKELYEGTKQKINNISNKFIIYQGASTIYEGTFDVYFPVRFELWFKSDFNGKEKKLAEKEYLIEGWDR